jgi:hypothetical protein
MHSANGQSSPVPGGRRTRLTFPAKRLFVAADMMLLLRRHLVGAALLPQQCCRVPSVALWARRWAATTPIVHEQVAAAAAELYGGKPAEYLEAAIRARQRIRGRPSEKFVHHSALYPVYPVLQRWLAANARRLRVHPHVVLRPCWNARRGLGLHFTGPETLEAGTILMAIPRDWLIVTKAPTAAEAERLMASRLGEIHGDDDVAAADGATGAAQPGISVQPPHPLQGLVRYYREQYAFRWARQGHPAARDWRSFVVRTRCHHDMDTSEAQGGATVTLVPLFDFLNHSADPSVHYTHLSARGANADDLPVDNVGLGAAASASALELCGNWAAGVNSTRLGEPHLYVVALRPVQPGEELTYMYSDFDADSEASRQDWLEYSGFLPTDEPPAVMTPDDAAGMAGAWIERWLKARFTE